MADQNYGGQASQRKKIAFDNKKLSLYAKNEQGKNASLNWGLVGNNPRINVYTNVEGDKDNGRISANMNTPTFFAFLVLLKQAIAFQPVQGGEAEFKKKIENKRPNWKPGGGRPDGLITDSELWVGKDQDGVVWLSVTGYKRPRIKFQIVPDEYHMFFHATGEQFSMGEVSVVFAEGYYNMLNNMLAVLQVTEYTEPPARDAQGGGRQGGGGFNGSNRGNFQRGGNNNGGGGYQGGGNNRSSQPQELEEDLPF